MNGTGKTLLVRADASHAIGNGHVMRCLSLVEEWRGLGGNAHLLSHPLSPSLRTRATSLGCVVHELQFETGSVQDSDQTGCLVQELDADWLMIDGYTFTPEYVQKLTRTGARVACVVDDERSFPVDLILNQNAYAVNRRPCDPQVLKLFGGRYTQLRREFVATRQQRLPAKSAVQRILVTCGGTDPAGATSFVLRTLAHSTISNREVIAVSGSANPQLPELRSLCESLPYQCRLEVDTASMPRLMQWADLAIAAAGSTCWELAFSGVPMVVFSVAENQLPVARFIDQHGVGIDCGEFAELTPETLCSTIDNLAHNLSLRNRMQQSGQQLIDGQGAWRLARLMFDPKISLRNATVEDARLLWEWRNDPLVRSVSFSTEVIPFESHRQWLTRKLLDPNCSLWIAEFEDQPCGQIRFELSGDAAEISISLAAEFRSAGLGRALIRRATEQMLGGQHVTHILAKIKPENLASQKAFEKAGYQPLSTSEDDTVLTFVAGGSRTNNSTQSLQRSA